MERRNSSTLRKRGTHLTYEQRRFIERALKLKMTQAKIAEFIGCDRSVISRERRRGLVQQKQSDWTFKAVYNADVAQARCDGHKEAKGPGLKIGSDMGLAMKISRKIRQEHKSPDVIVHELRSSHPETMPCTKTLYSYINKGGIIPDVTNADLLEKPRRKKRKKRIKSPKKAHIPKKRIHERPDETEFREEFGHWELDLVLGAKGSSPAALMTLVERKTRFAIVVKLADKTQESVIKAFRKVERDMTSVKFRKVFRTITTDNGSEFLDWQSIEKSAFRQYSRTSVYFTDPYSSWQKGTNENFNRMLRRFVPKGSDIGDFTQKHIKESAEWLNNYLRKKLGYKTPKEMFEKEFRLVS